MYDYIYSEKNGTIKVWYNDAENWRERGIMIESDNGESLFLDDRNALSLIQGRAEVLAQHID